MVCDLALTVILERKKIEYESHRDSFQNLRGSTKMIVKDGID